MEEDQLLLLGERIDDLEVNGFRIIQNPSFFCFGMDAVLLANFARTRRKDRVMDLGTGTGVLPRNMYRYGAVWTGTDISPEQVRQAQILAGAENMKIDFAAVRAEEIDFPAGTFDVITACQCFWYFNHEKVIPKLDDLLKPDGKLLILYMAWLPYEDEIAGASEELVLGYSPKWSGAGERRHPIWIPDIA